MAVSGLRLLFLNFGHFLTHFLMLVFASVAALRLADEWGMSYGELIPYATPGYVAYGLLALPAGWLADRWSREGMMTLFFLGIGASSLLTANVESVEGIAVGLTLIGAFAAIYHPVGLSLVVQGRVHLGVPLAVNGVFGNFGVACAALVSAYLIEHFGWRSAFRVPAVITLMLGLVYLVLEWRQLPGGQRAIAATPEPVGVLPIPPQVVRRVMIVVLTTTALAGVIFQSTTFSLPKVFDERLAGLAGSASEVGGYVALVFAIAAVAQLLVGYMVDRYSLRDIFLTVAVLQAILFALMIELAGWPALLVSIAFMFAVFGEIPLSDVLIGRVARGAWRSRAFALNYLVGFCVSASTLPLIAWIHATRGFSALFAVLAVAAVSIAGTVLFLPRTEPGKLASTD